MKTNKIFPSLKGVLLEEPSQMPVNPIEPSPLPIEVQDVSLDMKVDSYFMKYEKESLPTQQNYQVPGTDLGFPMEEGTEFKKYYKNFLKEAEGDDPMADPSLGGGGDAGAGDTASASSDVPQPPQINNPRLDVSNFAQGVARLVLNYENLLDPKTTILNRAKAYVTKNYDAGVAEQMMQIIHQEFGLEPRNDMEGQGNPGPFAAGTWAGGGDAG